MSITLRIVIQMLGLLMLILASMPVRAGVKLRAIHLQTENGLPDNNVRCIYQDSIGYIWMGTLNGMYRYDGYHYVPFRRNGMENTRLLKSNRINSFIPWKDGMFLISHFDRYYSCYNPRSGQFVEFSATVPQLAHTSPANRIRMEGQTIYIDESNRLCCVNDSSGCIQRFTLIPPILSRQTNSLKIILLQGKNGLVWASTYGNGLFVLDVKNGEWEHLTTATSSLLLSNYINNIYEDHQGNLWVCQEHFGVSCISQTESSAQVMYLPSGHEDLRSRQIRALKRIGLHEVFIADNFGHGYLADDSLASFHPLPTGGCNILSACRDTLGVLWLGSRKDGLCVGKQWYRYNRTDSTSLCDNRIDCILRDERGRMWLGSYSGGLFLAMAGEEGHYHFRKFLSAITQLQSLIIDHRGYIWVAAEGGLYRFHPDELLKDERAYEYFRLDETGDLPCETVCVIEDSNHHIWAGTAGNGLFNADNNGQSLSFHHFDTKQGLTNNMVKCLLEDEHRRIWIGTENGCSIWTTDSLLHPLRTGNGLQDCYSENAAVLLSGNRPAFGSLEGIILPYETAWKRNKAHHLCPVITDIFINGESIILSNSPKLQLSYRQNNLKFMFSTLTYGSGPSVSYQYRLEGYDDDWSEWQYNGYTSYRDLPPGQYRLCVRATDKPGFIASAECHLAIRIAPHWSGTWWARFLFVSLAGSMLIFAVHQIRRYDLLRRRMRMEKKLNEFKLRILTDISHEFRTPLTLMKNGVDYMQEDLAVSGRMKQSLHVMQRSVERMIRLVNQLLEYRKVQEGKLTLRLISCDVVTLLYNIGQDFADVKEKKHVDYQFSSNRKSHWMYTDPGHLDKIVYNLLSNAFKYTPEGGSVSLRVSIDDQWLEIRVIDSGVGVPPDQQPHLFERYEHGSYSADSIGIGLNLSYELIHLFQGNISYQAPAEGGSVFIVRLPLDSSIYPSTCFVVEGEKSLEDSLTTYRKGFVPAPPLIRSVPMNDRTVMIVEDDADLCAYMAHTLSHYFDIVTASDGQEAIRLLQERVPDLIISDVMMPHIDGFELVKYVRRTPQYMYLPMILLTIMDAEQKHFKGLELGADDYIPKPFSLSMLVARSCNLIHQRDNLRIAFSNAMVKQPSAPRIIIEERDHQLMEQIDAWIDRHIGDSELTLEALYEHLGYGRSRFFAKFNALTGKTPREYIREHRLRKAAEMLRDSNMTISEVAYHLGFSTPQYLSTCFKAHFGMSPSQYQKGETDINSKTSCE